MIDADTATARWVRVSMSAWRLVLTGRIVALVFWQRADFNDLGAPDGHAGVSDPGFYWLAADRPLEAVPLFEVSKPTARDWARARALAARAYFDRNGPEAGTRHADQALRREHVETELRREAGQLLRRSRWWQQELLRE